MSSPAIGQPMLNFKFAEFPTPYSPERLQEDLSAGVGSILAGVGSNFRLNIDTANAFIVLGHKDAVYNAYSAPADTGNIRTPAIGLTANGIAMGFNDVDGSWKSSVAIDATTGNVTILGTLAANSVVSASAYLGATPVSTVVNNAAYGNAAYASLSSKLDKNASYVMEASTEFKTSGYAGGNGMMFSNNGIIAKSGGVNKFVIAANGNATFSGTLDAAGGRFNGNVTASGTTTWNGYSAVIQGYLSSGSGSAVLGQAYGDSASIGVLGLTSAGEAAVKGVGGVTAVKGVGTATGTGVSGIGAMGTGVYASSSSGISLHATGVFQWGSYAFSAPNGSSSSFLRADGVWGGITSAAYATTAGSSTSASYSGYLSNSGHSYALSGGTVSGSASASFAGNNKPGSSSGNGWLTIYIDGNPFYIPVWS